MTSYTIVIIKPLSIGRGDGLSILEDILHVCDVSLRSIHQTHICDTTWKALFEVSKNTVAEFKHENAFPNNHHRHSWICVFTDKLRQTNPTEKIRAYCGCEDMNLWTIAHLRYKYSAYSRLGKTTHPSDTVVYIAPSEKISLISKILIRDFDESLI